MNRAILHKMSCGWKAVVICACLMPAAASAQQDPLYSQYMFNLLAFNPAYAGNHEVISLMALTRHQWVGFEGAPTTQTLTGHSPLPVRNLALGGTVIHDKAGPVTQTGVFVDLAYRMRVSENSQLAFGLKGGFDLYNADVSSLSTVEMDPANAGNISEFLPNFGFGLFWHSERHYLGLSAPKLLTNEINSVDGVTTMASEARHYFLMGGYVFDLGRDLRFRPSFMLRAVEGAPLSLDLNAHFLLRDRIWFGALYRVGNAFGVMAQYQVNEQLRIGYAFDLMTNALGAHNAGTHELMVGYDLRFSRGHAISPRWF
jgi:type IX secretion system PorP/SprF family membrane protein